MFLPFSNLYGTVNNYFRKKKKKYKNILVLLIYKNLFSRVVCFCLCSCGWQIKAPQKYPHLLPGEYVILHDKRDLANVFQSQTLRWENYPESSDGFNTRVSLNGRQGSS